MVALLIKVTYKNGVLHVADIVLKEGSGSTAQNLQNNLQDQRLKLVHLLVPATHTVSNSHTHPEFALPCSNSPLDLSQKFISHISHVFPQECLKS